MPAETASAIAACVGQFRMESAHVPVVRTAAVRLLRAGIDAPRQKLHADATIDFLFTVAEELSTRLGGKIRLDETRRAFLALHDTTDAERAELELVFRRWMNEPPSEQTLRRSLERALGCTGRYAMTPIDDVQGLYGMNATCMHPVTFTQAENYLLVTLNCIHRTAINGV